MERSVKKTIIRNENLITNGFQWRPFLRQLLVSSGVWAVYFNTGLCMGAPTVIIPQLRREANSSEAVSDEMASWLSSVFGYTGLPWVLILAALVHYIGRKKTFMIVCFSSLLMFIVFYNSSTVKQLFISEILQGPLHGSSITVNIIIITEYSAPKYRGLFLTIKSATIIWGIWASNAIGTFFHWTYIPLFGIISSVYSFSTYFWPESPYWLASKGRIDQCSASHRWLKGTDKEMEKELEHLIQSQSKINVQKYDVTLKNVFKAFTLKEFYMPLLLATLMATEYHFSGKLVCSIYSIDIIKKITNNESAAYTGMLILDGVTVFSMYIGCGIARITKRRTLLLTSSTIGIAFLFILSLYLYLVKLNVIEENKYLSILFLACFSLSISSGPMIMATSIYGELIPLKFKSISVVFIALIFNLLHASLLKIAPYMFKGLEMHGTFLFYAITSSICIILIYKYLPETKDKTLLEIEQYFKGKPEDCGNQIELVPLK